MQEPHNPDDASPDPTPADCVKVRNVDAPDLGGSFEENGQVRRHDGIGAAPGLQPIVPLTSTRVAQEQDDESSAGS